MPTSEWTPTVDEVGTLLWARTKTNMGEVGTFNDETRPTADQVDRLIATAVGHVASRIGTDPCNESLKERAQGLAAIYAAMLVELSYFPEQVTDNSPYDKLKDLWDDGIKSLIDNVAGQCADSEVTEGEGAGRPHYAFDKATTDLGMNLPW